MFRHAILAKIASGGTATVYIGARTRDRSRSPALVAVKRPHAHILEDPRQREAVLREANVAASIHHANVVRVHEVESDGEAIQLVMDYVEGTALGTLIAAEAKRDTRIPPAIALRILLDACEGLAAVHRETADDGRLLGLVHRDVSPQNILVGVDGRARLTDFGLAKAVYTGAPSTTQGTLKGKLGYMAPEYVRAGAVDRAADVFALGVVLWEALAGARLFRGENEGQTLDRLLREDAPPLSSIDPSLAPLDSVVLSATAKDPAARFLSAVELASPLARAAALVGVATHAAVGVYVLEVAAPDLRARRTALEAAVRERRRPIVVMVLAALGATVAVAATVGLEARRHTPVPTPSVMVIPPTPSAPWTEIVTAGTAPRPLTAAGASAATPALPRVKTPPTPHTSAALPPNPYDRGH